MSTLLDLIWFDILVVLIGVTVVVVARTRHRVPALARIAGSGGQSQTCCWGAGFSTPFSSSFYSSLVRRFASTRRFSSSRC